MTFQQIALIFILFGASSCQGQSEKTTSKTSDKVLEYVNTKNENNRPSVSKGSVSNGSLVDGKLIPFSGKNFHYFDTTSYISGRAFVNDKVRNATLSAYTKLESLAIGRHFCIMECSHEHGGKLFPHKTHQNGLSIDFMVPLLKKDRPYYDLDNMGAQHYFMDFDNSGRYLEDKDVKIDFDLIALHILTLNEEAKKQGLKIDKVILKMELKDELFSTQNGQLLKKSSIYITKNLTPIINDLHDDHYHIDFKPIR